MRKELLLLALASLAAAGEPDAAVAEAGRWPHPRGPASGSGRSMEPLPQTLGPARWTFQTKSRILSAPVVWDGVAFVLHGTAASATLVALDVETGATLAAAPVKAPAPAPAVWNRSVYLVEEGKRLAEYRLEGPRFEQRWRFEAGRAAGVPRVHSGEIYASGAGGLLRLRAGARKPVWTAVGGYRGEPAVFGAHVYAIRAEAGGTLTLVAHRRTDGAPAASAPLPPAGEGPVEGTVVVAAEVVAVRNPGDGATWSVIARTEKEGALTLAPARIEKFVTAPIAREDRLVALAEGGRWVVVTPKRADVVADRTAILNLVDGCAAPTSIGGQVCFGTWACDFRTQDILWHLSERAEERAFANGVGFPAVPADGLVLLVSRDGKTLAAFGPEELPP
jgi:hypothetical protein